MSVQKRIRDYFRGENFKSHISPSDRFKGAVVVNQVHVRPIHRQSQDVTKWRNALQSAEGISQQRKLLYDLYHEIMLDTFLIACVEKRVRSITNRDLTFIGPDGKEIEEVARLADTSYFEDMLKGIVESRIYGHTLMEFHWPGPQTDFKGWTKTVDRRHVKPRYGIVTEEAQGTSGISYREGKLADQLIEAGGDEDLGLLLECCPYVIYKRGNFGDWAEFVEVFGMPFRTFEYDNDRQRELYIEALDKMGSAGYAAFPKGGEFKFHMPNSNGNNSEIFDKLRKACNEEIAIRILGNTMTTTEAKNSGYAQSKTHESGEQEIYKDERQYALRILNETLTPKLGRLGWPVKDGFWQFVEEETMTLTERLAIDLKISEKVPVPISYWYEKYKVPRPSADDPAIDEEVENDDIKDDVDNESEKNKSEDAK